MSELALVEIDSVDWVSYEECDGPATGVGSALAELLTSNTIDEASAAWEGLEEHVFSQGTVYSVAEPVVSILMAALAYPQPSWRSGRIVDLLFFIVSGASKSGGEVAVRCQARAKEGVWLLAHRALTSEGWVRQNALEVLDYVDAERALRLRILLDEPS